MSIWQGQPFGPGIWRKGVWRSQTNALLNQFRGAAAAYSLRDLTGTNPSVVRVRRSNDNAEKDFAAVDISDGSLVAWVGAGNDGFVSVWYDQSGSGNDATQTTAAIQPKIVDAGVLVTEKGKAALSFDGYNDYLNAGLTDVSVGDRFTFLSWVYTKSVETNNAHAIIGGGYGSDPDGITIFTSEYSPSTTNFYTGVSSTFNSGWVDGNSVNKGYPFSKNEWVNLSVDLTVNEADGGDHYLFSLDNNSNNFNGLSKELIIFNRPLNQSEIQSIMAYGA